MNIGEDEEVAGSSESRSESLIETEVEMDEFTKPTITVKLGTVEEADRSIRFDEPERNSTATGPAPPGEALTVLTTSSAS